MAVSDVTDINNEIKPIIDKFNGYINSYDEYNKHHEHYHKPTIAELDQFHKTWFYENWETRFRKINAFTDLGTKGVTAIPNTTFEDWLYWFWEWAKAWMDDYNDFKNQVYKALALIEKHLEAVDKTLEDHEERIEKIEKEIEDIYKKIDEINKEISNIKNEISNIHKEINDLKQMLKSNISPSYSNVTAQDVGAKNGWYRNLNAQPNGLNIQYRWVMNNDHSQGLYMQFNINRVVNDHYDDTKKLILEVDLTNFVNETKAQIPYQGWIGTSGSYWTTNQRAGMQYYYRYDNNTHIMKVQIDALFGVSSENHFPGRIEISAISNEFYVSVGG